MASKDILAKASYLIKAAAAVYLVREHVAELTVCVGPSMLPTFNVRGDVILLEHISVWSNRIQVGDVVVARSVQNPRHVVCKRVLAMEGDPIPYSSNASWSGSSRVPQGHVWLQGDNFYNSTDSRHYGPVPYALLRGRALVKIWPPWEAKMIDRQIPSQR